MEYKILLVEDEQSISDSLTTFLKKEGFQVVQAFDGEVATTSFDAQSFDLVLLDMMLPKKSGELVLRHIREKSDLPIIIISALNDELIQLDAFEQRVDDYVVKPFSMNILIYKVKALLRRIHQENDKTIHYQGITLQVDNYHVEYEGKEINLTAKEFELVQLFLANQGRVYTREELLTIIWGYDYYGDVRNIDVHIKNVRKKIPVEFIKTVKGIGYRAEKANK